MQVRYADKHIIYYLPMAAYALFLSSVRSAPVPTSSPPSPRGGKASSSVMVGGFSPR